MYSSPRIEGILMKFLLLPLVVLIPMACASQKGPGNKECQVHFIQFSYQTFSGVGPESIEERAQYQFRVSPTKIESFISAVRSAKKAPLNPDDLNGIRLKIDCFDSGFPVFMTSEKAVLDGKNRLEIEASIAADFAEKIIEFSKTSEKRINTSPSKK